MVLQVIIMEYRGAGLSVDSSGQPWSYYGQASPCIPALALVPDILHGFRRLLCFSECSNRLPW